MSKTTPLTPREFPTLAPREFPMKRPTTPLPPEKFPIMKSPIAPSAPKFPMESTIAPLAPESRVERILSLLNHATRNLDSLKNSIASQEDDFSIADFQEPLSGKLLSKIVDEICIAAEESIPVAQNNVSLYRTNDAKEKNDAAEKHTRSGNSWEPSINGVAAAAEQRKDPANLAIEHARLAKESQEAIAELKKFFKDDLMGKIQEPHSANIFDVCDALQSLINTLHTKVTDATSFKDKPHFNIDDANSVNHHLYQKNHKPCAIAANPTVAQGAFNGKTVSSQPHPL